MKRIKTYLKLTARHILRTGLLIKQSIKHVEHCYEMSEEEINKYKEKRFIKIFQRAYDKSPFYHKLYSEAGIKKEDIKSLADLTKLPIITKEMVRQHAEEILTVPKWQVIESHTSGTTGTPLRLYEDWHSIWLEHAYHICARKRAGFVLGEAFVSLRGHLDKNITHLFVAAQNTLYLSSYNINSEHVDIYYNLLKKHNPKAIEGYPSSLYSLALLFSDKKISLKIPIAFTSSETLFPYQRELIERVFNTEIFDLYGMTERTICLMEANSHDEYYEMPGYSINEYLDDGEICTSLINSSFPLIRYRSNDVIEIEKKSNGNLKRQEKIKRIQGRVDDYIICMDGTKVTRLGFVVKDVVGIRYTQLFQSEIGKLEIRIVVNNDFDSKEEDKLRKNLYNRIGEEGMEISVKRIEEKDLIYSRSGKLKYVISNCK